MKMIRLFLGALLVAGVAAPVSAQTPDAKRTQKQLIEVVKELPADVQAEVLKYAERKRDALKKVEAQAAAVATPAPAAPTPAPTPAVATKPAPQVASAPATVKPAPAQASAPAVYPPQADPAKQQTQAKPAPAPAQPALAGQPQAIELNNATAAPAAPAAPDYLQKAQAMNQTTVEWAQTDFDFGKVKTGAVVTHTFKFKNTGTEPLSLTRVKASCGCTTPKYSSEPVQPGQEGFIDISFNTSGKTGFQTKTVTVTGNFPTNNLVLKIRGEVEGEVAAPAPAGPQN
ncbi:MAG: DUF1573 domain-containing protein [Bacteroidetes bacterium]|nr:MAG: DUF1573 domain-containing protein [Bacteroidota bacterium]